MSYLSFNQFNINTGC